MRETTLGTHSRRMQSHRIRVDRGRWRLSLRLILDPQLRALDRELIRRMHGDIADDRQRTVVWRPFTHGVRFWHLADSATLRPEHSVLRPVRVDEQRIRFACALAEGRQPIGEGDASCGSHFSRRPDVALGSCSGSMRGTPRIVLDQRRITRISDPGGAGLPAGEFRSRASGQSRRGPFP